MAENYFGITDKGRQRQNNEDTFIANTILNNRFIAACVIDGVGGYEGGEVAADIAKQALSEQFTKSSPDPIDMLRLALLTAHKNILTEKQKVAANNKMACVLTVVLVENNANKFYYAHVGDTRLYLFRDNSLVKITTDHSFVGLLEDSGRIDEEAAMAHPKRNEINKALGFEAPIVNADEYFETGESPFLPGDLLLLCSDGLTDMIDRTAIIKILSLNKKLEYKGKALIDAANNAGGKDNITVVLVQNDHKPVNYPQPKERITKTIKKSRENENEIEKTPINPISKKNKPKNQGLIFFLALLAFISTAAFLWQYFTKDEIKTSNSVNAVPGANNVYDQSFQDTINNSPANVLLLTDSMFGSSIVLQDTVFISKDSIHIKGGSNLILTGDTLAKTTVPFVIAQSVKYLLFENINIRNAAFIIYAQNIDVLKFKDVHFTNTHLAIINQFKNGMFSGSIKDMVVADQDSSVNLNP